MLTITRNRSWASAHTVYDSLNGPLADLRGIVTIKSQIRSKTQTRNKDGFFEQPLVVDVEVARSGAKLSYFTLSLSENITSLLPVGDYLIDVVGIRENGTHEPIIPPESVKVVNCPTHPQSDDTVPDFTAIFHEALLQ